MTIEIQKYVRKPFFVDAIQVTAENIIEVAEWCDGDVRTDERAVQKGDNKDFIQVRVHRPLNERQTKAFVGDWILYAGTGYKVYTSKAFMGCFELTPPEGVLADKMIQAGKVQPTGQVSTMVKIDPNTMQPIQLI